MSAIAPALQEYFTQRLIGQRQASPHTVAAYRDCFRLLFAYLAQTSGKQPAELGFEDLDAGTISGFLTHLEKQRGVSVPTRDARLVALRSWFAFAAHRHPEHAALIARVLTIPSKRRDRPLVSFLEPDEADALMKAPRHQALDRTAGPGPAHLRHADRPAGIGADGARCGQDRPPAARWPEGPVCDPCYTAALRHRGRCASCGQQRRLAAPPARAPTPARTAPASRSPTPAQTAGPKTSFTTKAAAPGAACTAAPVSCCRPGPGPSPRS
jgi:Phage integrase, N-terminal SAM-like domain